MKKLFYFLMVGFALPFGIQNQIKAAAAAVDNSKRDFFQALMLDNVDVVRKILIVHPEWLNPEWLAQEGVLSKCVEHLAFKVLVFFIEEKKIDVNLRDINGNSPALLATELLYKQPSQSSEHSAQLYKMVKFLMDHGAHPKSRNAIYAAQEAVSGDTSYLGHATLEQRLNDLARMKKSPQEEARIEQERARIEQERVRIEQEKARIQQELSNFQAKERKGALVVLGLNDMPAASVNDANIKKAWKKLTIEWHPDKFAKFSPDVIKIVTEISQILTNARDKLLRE